MDKKLLMLAVIFFLAFSINLSLIVFENPISRAIKAKDEQKVSLKDSLVFAWPYSVLADGKTNSLITVFVKSDTGSPVPNKQVFVNTNLGDLSNQSAMTDNTGKVEFSLTSTVEGDALVEASIDNNKVTNTVTVQFKN
jgi:hypothetical protein